MRRTGSRCWLATVWGFVGRYHQCMWTIFEHLHPREGFLRLIRNGDAIEAVCRWPFDAEVDDWICIRNAFRASDVERAAKSLTTDAKASVRGTRHGFLEFTTIPQGVRVELEDGVAFAPTRLALNLSDSASALGTRLLSELTGAMPTPSESRARG